MSNPLLTAEDRAALAAMPRDTHRKVRVTTAVRDLTRLRPWMQLFAYWYAFAPFKTSVTEQRKRASGFARDDVSSGQLRALKEREDFRTLVLKYQEGGVSGALEKLKADLPYYVDTHKKGLEMAVAAEDYAAIPKFTLHALEIVAPRRNDLAQQNVQVNVTLSPKQQALLDSERPTIEVEVVKPEKPIAE